MRAEIDGIWKELRRKNTAEQAFYTILMILFFSLGAEGQEKEWCSRKAFLSLFLDTPDYDLKEAALRFSEKVDWNRLKMDREERRYMELLAKDLQFWTGRRKARPVENLEELVQSLLVAAAADWGYSYTPESVRTLAAELFRGTGVGRMADFGCGIGLLGMKVWDSVWAGNGAVEYTGVEWDQALCDIHRIAVFLSGIHPGKTQRRDLQEIAMEEAGQTYDLIVMDTPRGSNKMIPCQDGDLRLSAFGKKMIYTDWLWIQEALRCLKDGGYAAVLATPGALIRSNESKLRRKMVEEDWLEAVFTLPSNLYPEMAVGTELLIFHKKKDLAFRNRILFADLSDFAVWDKKNICSLSAEGIRTAVDCYREKEEREGICTICRTEEIDRNNDSWKPLQYLNREESFWGKKSICLEEAAAVIRGAQVGTQKGGEQKGDACFLNIRDIQNGMIRYEDAEKIDDSHAAYKEKFRIQEDDIVLTSKGAVMKLAIVGKGAPPAFISGNLTILRVDRNVYDPYVLFAYLHSAEGSMALEKIQSGTTIRILNNSNLKKLKIPGFRTDVMREIGRELKEKKEIFITKQKELQEGYERDRAELLCRLKEEG